ncbi:hypothetical protein [Bdellovibrio sp. HCB209]|uniref:hypothetical protein n=1 Tax=Bdellovibrio sp. HCB209 TaxID=3394354 RepID=UPI0039B3D8D5
MKWIVLVLTVFSLSFSYAEEDLPMPLPDDPGHSDPAPQPPQNPYPEDPGSQPPQQPQPPSGPSRDYGLGAGDTGRFKERTFTFYPNSTWNKVTRIQLQGTRNNVKIKSVEVFYADYPGSRYEYNLMGELTAGTTRLSFLDGRPITAIKVVASNKYFWKKPGGFRVDVTAYR